MAMVEMLAATGALEFLPGVGCRSLLCRLAGLLQLKKALPMLNEWFGPAAATPKEMEVSELGFLALDGRGENIRLLVLSEMVQRALCAENWVPGCSSPESDSLHEWVQVESDYEPEPPWTIWNSSADVFDIPGEVARRGLDEHEFKHFVFEHAVAQGLRLAEMNLEDGDDSSVVFQGGAVEVEPQPRVLHWVELIPAAVRSW